MNTIDTNADELKFRHFCHLLDIPAKPTTEHWAAWIARLNADKEVVRQIEESPIWVPSIQQENAGAGEDLHTWNGLPVIPAPAQRVDFIHACGGMVSIDLARENGFCAEVEEPCNGLPISNGPLQHHMPTHCQSL